jgi:hypothetical protein
MEQRLNKVSEIVVEHIKLQLSAAWPGRWRSRIVVEPQLQHDKRQH